MTLSFDAIAQQFDDQRGLPPHAIAAWVKYIDSISAGRTLQVIEPGIGSGRISLPLAVAGHHITGIDISQPMLRRCTANAAAIGVVDHLTLHLGDATDLPVRDSGFDLGIIAQLLYLVPNWTDVLDELARVVRPGGVVIHLTEETIENDALRQWSRKWRELVEANGYRHSLPSPTEGEIGTEFLRRWPDTNTHQLATWPFGQPISAAREDYGHRIRALYAGIEEAAFANTVDRFMEWSQGELPDEHVWLGGDVALVARVARL